MRSLLLRPPMRGPLPFGRPEPLPFARPEPLPLLSIQDADTDAHGIAPAAAAAMASPDGPARHLCAACKATTPSAALHAFTRFCEATSEVGGRALDAEVLYVRCTYKTYMHMRMHR